MKMYTPLYRTFAPHWVGSLRDDLQENVYKQLPYEKEAIVWHALASTLLRAWSGSVFERLAHNVDETLFESK